MKQRNVDARFGTQIWLEQHDSAERVDELFGKAASLGFGQVRLFLMWPWIQPASSDDWEFRLFDAAFDAAERYGIRIKATLTANSGPWWLGTPSVLHSHTPTLSPAWLDAAAAYVRACVRRYHRHPGLGQWILWNEPLYAFAPNDEPHFRGAGSSEEWARVLSDRYNDDIAQLNERWRSGLGSFAEVPFPEDLAHPAHRSSAWQSFGPVLADVALRTRLLGQELDRIASFVRETDQITPLCVNPNQVFLNLAEYGYELTQLAGTVDTLGASFHAPWAFSFATKADFTALVCAGVRLLQSAAGPTSTEVTEVQTGNTFYAGGTPAGVGPAEIGATYLAPLLVGAQSVTGWCFNTRQHDFEAGEWGLLDDDDAIGERAATMHTVRRALESVESQIGAWQPEPVRAVVAVSERSQAVQLAMAQGGRNNRYAASTSAASQGAALITVEMMRLGVPTSLSSIDTIDPGSAQTLILPNVAAWDESDARSILTLADNGATVVLDATTGQFDTDAGLHRPWPGTIGPATGIRSAGLSTATDRADGFELLVHGHRIGAVAPVEAAVDFDENWAAETSITLEHSGSPVLWRRTWGSGSIVYCTVSLTHSALAGPDGRAAVSAILGVACGPVNGAAVLTPDTVLLPIQGERQQAFGLFGPTALERHGTPMTVLVSPGHYFDAWSGTTLHTTPNGLLRLEAHDGIALFTSLPE